MFVGHLAAGLGARRVAPSLPLGAAVAAAFGLDLLWPLLLLGGVEQVRVSPHDTAFTHLAFESYPWSHSLVAVIGWAVVAAAVGSRACRSRRAGMVAGALVASHWFLDVLVHRPDLPLWPGGPRVGLGLWNSLAGTYALEGALLALGVLAYTRRMQARDLTGRAAFASLLVVCTVIWASQPWAPPPPSAVAVAWGALVLWLLPPWSAWAERHRRVRETAS